jgi:hypothetical protein
MENNVLKNLTDAVTNLVKAKTKILGVKYDCIYLSNSIPIETKKDIESKIELYNKTIDLSLLLIILRY